MQVLFLGTGGYHPNHRRQTAGVLLPELGLLFDAGTGLFRLADHLQRPDLTVVLSHAHLDHVCGLTYLLAPLHYGQIKTLRILGMQRALAAVREHLFAGPIFPVQLDGIWTPIDELAEIPLEGGAVLRHRPLASHPGESVAYRVDWRETASGPTKSLAYITDTRVDGSYDDFVRGVDLLIHECYFPDEQQAWADKTGHSHTSAVARLACECHVKRLLLTHIDPLRPGDDPIGLAAARALFPNVELAEDLLQVTV